MSLYIYTVYTVHSSSCIILLIPDHKYIFIKKELKRDQLYWMLSIRSNEESDGSAPPIQEPLLVRREKLW